MANYADAPIFENHNDYYTQKSSWALIKDLVMNKGYNRIYEPCLLNSNEQSKKFLIELGFEVYGSKTHNFITDSMPEEFDCIITNPPFEAVRSFNRRHDNLKYKIIKKIFDSEKPFVIIMNSTNLFSRWFKELAGDKDFQVVFPSKKLQYDKYEEGGENRINQNGSCSFNSVFLTYKIVDKNIFL